MSIAEENLTEVSLHRGKKHTPSPLKNQMSRSSSISSSSSNRSNVSQASANQYIIPLNKTPQNLTPSQRLKLRKSQVSSSIAKLKTSDVVVEDNTLENCGDSDCDEVDEIMAFSNPNSSATSSTSSTSSTRPCSVFSHDGSDLARSYNSSSSLFSSSSSSFSEDLVVAKNTEEPLSSMVLFNNSEYLQIFEETRQRRRLLTEFTKSQHQLIPQIATQSLVTQGRKTSPSKVTSMLSIMPGNDSSDHLEKEPTANSGTVTYMSDNKSTEIVSSPSTVTLIAPPQHPVPRFNMRSSSTPSLSSPPVTPPTRSVSSSLPSQPSMASYSSTSKYYSFTRPAWLPPKSSQDKRKHQKEAEQLIQRAISAESKQVRARISRLENHTKLKAKDLEIWQDLLNTISHAEFQQKLAGVDPLIWWRGIPSDLRPQIWWKHFNSPASIKQFDLNCLDEAERSPILLKRISKDVKDPSLIKVLAAFAIHLSKNGTSSDLLSYYVSSLNPVVAMFLAAYRNIYKTFVSVCHVFSNTQLLSVLLVRNSTSDLVQNSIFTNAINDSFVNSYDQEFEKQLPQLAAHFHHIGLSTWDYLPDLALGLLSNQLSVRLSCHIMDIFLFGNFKSQDDCIGKLILGYIKSIQYKLFGSKDEVLQLIKGRTYVGTDFEFIEQLH